MKKIILLVALTLTLGACQSWDFARRVKQQGNLLSKSKVERLRPGMSKEDVVTLLGSDLLTPIFNQDRWDYAYTWQKGYGPMKKRTVSLYFANGRLKAIEKHLD